MHTPITNKRLTQTMIDATNNEMDVCDDPPDERYHLESWGIDDWCRSHNLEPGPSAMSWARGSPAKADGSPTIPTSTARQGP
jgi:hypothetical protein